ncbi:MAG: hypothetical protein ABI333_08280 [bacterium]
MSIRIGLCRSFGILALATLLAACGGRTLTGGGDAGINSNGNHNGNGNSYSDAGVGLDGGTSACIEDDQCVIAIRTDNCCEAAQAASLIEVESDNCLELWPPMWDHVPQNCLDAWDPQCAYIDCMPGPPRWRIAGCNASGTACVEQPECQTASDCTLAIDTRKCCPCPEGVPPALVDRDPCFIPHPQGGNAPQYCYPTMCPEMPCSQCTNNPPRCIDDNVCWNDNPGW